MANRYSTSSNSARVARTQSRQRAVRRARGLARTLADSPAVSTSELQSRMAARNGVSANYARYGVQNNGQSVRGRRAEGVNPRTGNAVAGREHNQRYRQIRQALGLTSG